MTSRGTNEVTSGAITAQGAISAARQALGIGAITTSGTLTLSANAASITHSGTNKLTIASTSGEVYVEGVTFDGDAVSGVGALGCGAITTTGAITVGFPCLFVHEFLVAICRCVE